MQENIILLNTGTQPNGVSLVSRSGGGILVWTRSLPDAAEPAAQLLPALDTVLAQGQVARAELSAVAFAQGPGGFTGLRVGCALAQGLAFALDLPVLALSSLLAAAEYDRGHTASLAAAPATAWVVLQDARMGEVYLAVYGYADEAHWHCLHPPSLIGVGGVAAYLAAARAAWVDGAGKPLALRAVGNALAVHPMLAALPVWDSVGAACEPDAHAWARLALAAWDAGATLPAELATPFYVRDKIAYTTQERAQGLGGNPKVDQVLHAAQSLRITPMTAHHLAQVVDIERSVQSFPWTLGNFDDALRSGYAAWVVQEDGKVQGFYVLMCAPDVAHLLVLAVARDAQRRGLGRWLIQHACEQTRRQGLAAVLLEVRPSNVAARAFYQQLGFTTLSVRKDYYPAAHGRREDALVLRKTLAAPAVGAGA